MFVGGSDFGYLTAAAADMNVAASRGDRDLALDVFRTVARGLAVVFESRTPRGAGDSSSRCRW